MDLDWTPELLRWFGESAVAMLGLLVPIGLVALLARELASSDDDRD